MGVLRSQLGWGLWGRPWAEEPALPFQAWELHLPHPHQQQHPTAPQPDPADEVSVVWGVERCSDPRQLGEGDSGGMRTLLRASLAV